MNCNAVSTTMSVALTAAFAATAMGQQITGTPGSPSATELKHRSHLPMPNSVWPSLITYDAKSPDTKYPPSSNCARPRERPTS